jgi:hypothetical protein
VEGVSEPRRSGAENILLFSLRSTATGGRRCRRAFACNPQLICKSSASWAASPATQLDLQSAPLQAASTSIVITIKMTLAKCPWVHVLQKQQYEETYRECRIAQMSEAEYGIWVE